MRLVIKNIWENIIVAKKTLHFIWDASKKTMAIILLMTVILGLTVPINTIIWSNFLNALVDINTNHSLANVIFWLAVNWGVWVINGILRKVNKYYNDMQTDYINLYITNKVLNKINDLEMVDFDDSTVYDKLNKINSEALSRSISVMHNLITIIQNLVSLLGIVGIIILYKPVLVILLLVTFIPILTIDIKISAKLHNIYISRLEKLRLVTALKTLMIKYENIKELKIIQIGEELVHRVSEIYKKYLSEDKIIRKKNVVTQSMGDSIEYVTKFFFTLYVIIDCINRKFSMGNIVMYINSIDNLMQAIGNIVFTFSNTYNDNLYMQTLFDFMDLKITTLDTSINISLYDFKKIEMKHVYFKYPKSDKYVLEDINLEIEANKSYLIIGLNGSGKTTLIKLLCGLYEPNSGKILIDGIDITKYNKNSYRKNFTVVFQDFIHFPMTVANNIKFGRYEDFNDNLKMIWAAQQSGAIKFIGELPESFETQLQNEWSEGTELSIGQWQKLAITRAFFSDAPITIMDEPAASLDAIAEHELYMGIEEIIRNKTCIMISHRFTTAKLVDKIIVIDDHTISEIGSFDDLINSNGKFKELFTLQAEKYNIKDILNETT